MDDELEKYRFPKTLDQEMRILGLPPDEFIPIAILIILGVFIGQAVSLMIVAGLYWISIRECKKGQGSTFLLNLGYWHLPTELFRIVFRVIPKSHRRHYL